MKPTCKFDPSHFQHTFKTFIKIAKKDAEKELRVQAKGFIRTVIGITPPNSGKANSAAKKAGEQAIIADLAKVMVPVRSRKNRTLQTPESVYLRLRLKSNGRINPRNLKRPIPVDSAAFRAFRKKLIEQVGILAAGWNSAAAELGVRVPAWIKRHGASRGSIRVTVSVSGMKITMDNKVNFADNVKDLERRINTALQYQTRAMQRQIGALLTKAGKKAGFK